MSYDTVVPRRGEATTIAPDLGPTSIIADEQRTILLNRISWGAVVAGVVAALVTQLLLNLLGIGVGVATVGGQDGTADAQTFSIAAAAWWVVSGIIAAFFGGYVAGRTSGRPMRSTAAWHGFTAWAVTTLVVAYLVTTAVGGILGGAMGALGNAVGGVGSAVRQAAPQLAQTADPFAPIERDIRGGGNDPAALQEAAVAAVRAAVTADPAQAQRARDQAAQALAQARGIPVEQARTEVDQYVQQYRSALESARQQAVQAAETAATVVSSTALVTALALILGALAGWFGGRSGAVRADEEAIHRDMVARGHDDH